MLSVGHLFFERFRGVLLVALLCLGLVGCTQTISMVSSDLKIDNIGQKRVLLMPTDVLVQELSAGGVLETNAEWTAQGKSSMEQALAKALGEKNAHMIRYDPSGLGKDEHIQLLKLHEAVGTSIRLHKYVPYYILPTKRDKFDWSLGSDAALLREAYDADYALFVYFRDSIASPGRVAVILLTVALTAITIPGGQQYGFASLVELSTGNVLWFNVLRSKVGDIRSPDGALDAAEDLLEDLPL